MDNIRTAGDVLKSCCTTATSARLVDKGVATYIDAKHEIAHNKVMVLDGATVITGSFNFTKQAETSNAENLVVIEGKPKREELRGAPRALEIVLR